MQITFLEARVPLTKKFTATSKDPYPNAFEFTSHTHTVGNLTQLTHLIKAHAAKGHCLLKGQLDRPLKGESRAGRTNAHQVTEWACLDVDGLKSMSDINMLMQHIGLASVSYILQWSASYGVNSNFTLRAHIFIFFRNPVSPAALKLWLKQLNLTLLQQDLELTKTNVSLRWGLDITTCQNDKLLYITPPECNPPSINTFTGDRIQLVQKKNDLFDFGTVTLMSAEQLKTLEEQEINRLRRAQNMPERRANQFRIKEFKGESYLPNPDQATVTGTKQERGFIYLNLNNGDSWAYYHPEDNPTFVYNFKGEPTYRTSELLPEYWQSVQSDKRTSLRNEHNNKTFLAFRDLRTSNYYNGWYDDVTEELVLHEAKNEKQLADFLANYGQSIPESIPIWNIEYSPLKTAIDVDAKTVNTFKPSIYMRKAVNNKTTSPGPTPIIDRVLRHVIGDEMLDHFLNWLAYSFQYRTAPCTSWILHGTQGTGKGVLVNYIIAPLFGQGNVALRRMEELEEKFNDYIEGSLIMYIDEAQISDSPRSKMIMANIKNYITEPYVTVRRMRQSSYEIQNHCAWLFGSNMPDPVIVDSADRRFNVAVYQAIKLLISAAEISRIADELQNFAYFLQQYRVDTALARTPKHNTAKDNIIAVSKSSADVIAEAIINGDLSVLWEALPSIDASKLDNLAAFNLGPYKQLIYELVQTKRNKLTREELYIIFNYNVGGIPSFPHKLTSYLKHRNIQMKEIRMGEKIVRGTVVEWKNDELWFAARKREIDSEKTGVKPQAQPQTPTIPTQFIPPKKS